MVINRNRNVVDNIVELAEDFANEAHAGQTRRYTNEPYFNHVFSVAERVKELTDDEEIIAAALLHDTVEDTEVTDEDILNIFGDRIAALVYDLTDHFTSETYPNLNRKQRKKLEAERIGKANGDVRLIKLCDIADNTGSIVEHDPGFARIYMKEKSYLLKQMGY